MLKKRTGSLKVQIVVMVLALLGVFWAMKSMNDSPASSGFMEVMMSGQVGPTDRSARIITHPAEVPEEPAESDTSVDKGR